MIFPTKKLKYEAVINEVIKYNKIGRPILIGTSSVEESETLGDLLEKYNIKSNILNAKNDEFEAQIIAKAGEKHSVTVSTNMAGRGVDIKLGGENEEHRRQVVELGGLYVISINKNESMRIDKQLKGRAGRQGDPGTTQFFISLEDELLVQFGIKHMIKKTKFEDFEKDLSKGLPHQKRKQHSNPHRIVLYSSMSRAVPFFSTNTKKIGVARRYLYFLRGRDMLLRIAMNTYVPVLDIIKNKGYKISCELDDDNDYNDWIAIKEDYEISATNPVELLGLVMVIETYGKNWNKKSYESKYEDYL